MKLLGVFPTVKNIIATSRMHDGRHVEPLSYSFSVRSGTGTAQISPDSVAVLQKRDSYLRQRVDGFPRMDLGNRMPKSVR